MSGITQLSVVDATGTSRSVQVYSSTGAVSGNLSPLQTVVGVDAATQASGTNGLPILQGTSATCNITSATVVKAIAGRLVRLSVISEGTSGGTVNDCATTGAAAAANQFFNIPQTVGVWNLDWPCSTGIVVVPGTSQVVAVSYA